ncbi:TRAP transporter small permease subunit [Tistrella bauzanensis]|uniref:TRAP transporter small permease protein n=1 Tax=Tistrella arctica TaxID=3133430 RepID=A0ABU9YJ61_9PROT
METLDRLIGRLEAVFEYVAVALLAVMMLLIAMDAGGRYLFASPVFGTHEFVETYLMVGVVFLGIAQLQAKRGHVAVEFVSRHFPAGIRRLLEALFLALTLFAVSLIAWMAVEQIWTNIVRDRVIATPFPFTQVPMPVYPSWVLLAAGVMLLWLRMALQLLRCLLDPEPPRAADDVVH